MRTQAEFWVLYVKWDTKKAGGAHGRGLKDARLDITQSAKGGGLQPRGECGEVGTLSTKDIS